ncbi:MAG: DUF87 domain-containing protein [Candidatus Lokiarchaeota archaeon]|nr:DUF87 domain-containing protein [Candidatus Lokiarchaeota archaeon]
MTHKIGTVITGHNEPNVNQFRFVVDNNGENNSEIPIKKGQYVELFEYESKIIAMVIDIFKTNRYFARAESVQEYNKLSEIQNIFPTDRWEYIVGIGKPIGKYNKNNSRLDQVSYPPSPGDSIYLASDETLIQLMGLNISNGLNLGKIRYHETLDAKFDLTRLVQKHIAILAMSGAGKSYTSSVLIEELLKRRREHGRIASIIIDVHGEYSFLNEKAKDKLNKIDFSNRIKLIKSPFMTLNTALLSAYQISKFQSHISPAQTRELNRIIWNYRQQVPGYTYSLKDLIEEIEKDDQIHVKTKDALLGWLYPLDNMEIFTDQENPNLEEEIVPGRGLILDLSDTISIMKKQILVSYFAQRLFDLRKNGKICPFILIIEEAHQFCPEGKAISKKIIETYSREGRKFGASLCLLSQRPVKLSTTALSQCGSHIIMRITNPYDLDHIRKSSEQITSETLGLISNLPVGEALIVGAATNFPLFVQIRKKLSSDKEAFLDLQDEAKKWEKIHNNNT